MRELAPGDVFAGHRIEGIAGRGGMGVVYRAVQLDLDRRVALKLIAPQLAEDPAFRERFVGESRAAAAIDHPHVIPIYYTGEDGGSLYIAMRYVEGSDLRTLVRAEGRLAPARAAEIVAQVASALDAAHARGIVHRDVKPANVLLGEGDHAYLTDFGLTKRLASHTGMTQPGGLVGTLGYVAPEQIRGERVEARTDVYALGCVLFHALTGRPPYQRDSDEAMLWAHLHDPPPHVRDAAPDVPEPFEALLARALAKTPDRRFASAGDLGRAARAAAGIGAPARAETVVATGAAAPARDAETIAVIDQAPGPATPAQDAETVTAVDRASRPDANARGRGRSSLRRRGRSGTRPRWRWALALLPLGAIAAVAAFAVGGDDDGPTMTPTGPAARTPALKVDVDGRPASLVIAHGDLWVIRSGNNRVLVLDDATGERRNASPAVEGRPTGVGAGLGELFVATERPAAVVPIDLNSAEQSLAAIPLPPGAPAVALATAGQALWIGIRSSPGLLLKVNPNNGRTLKEIPLPAGVQDIAAGEGAIWVIARRDDIVTRVDTTTGQARSIAVGSDPTDVAIGEGAAWVTNASDDSVTRIDADPDSLATSTIAVGDRPQGIAVGGGSVWVANRDDATISRIDPERGDVTAAPVDVDAGPFAIAAGSNHLWVGSLNTGTVQRIDF